MTTAATFLGALLLAFVAYKLLMGVVRIAIILLIAGVLYGLWSQGALG